MSRPDAALLIRQARKLVEEALPLMADLPVASSRLEAARQVLGELGGDYREGDDAPSAPRPSSTQP